jgi:hypothetical protein
MMRFFLPCSPSFSFSDGCHQNRVAGQIGIAGSGGIPQAQILTMEKFTAAKWLIGISYLAQSPFITGV